MYEYLELLVHIAKKGGFFGKFETSTIKLAKKFGLSQQSISRKLREMEQSGLIRRLASTSGVVLNIDEKGRSFLKEHYCRIRKLFDAKDSLEGSVKSGIGEGSYYVSQLNYQRQFNSRLGFEAYPGTLNVKIDKESLLLFLSDLEEIKISGFKTKERTFGSLKCYKIKLGGKQAAIVVPERTRHGEDIIEIISPVNLRKYLKINESDTVIITK